MTLPTLTESAIRTRASSKTWQRGEAYQNDDSVHSIIWRGDKRGILSAAVYGNTDYEYLIQITIANNEIVSADCSCPYDFGGDCKHIVATALYLIHSPDGVEERQDVASIIAGLGYEHLAWILRMLAERQPDTIDAIELLASQAKIDVPTDPTGAEPTATDPMREELVPITRPVINTVPLPAINENLLRRQIIADLPNTIEHGHSGWGGESWYDSDLSTALGPAVEQIQLLLDADEPKQALSVLAVATDAWDKGANKLDDYFYEHFEHSDVEFLFELKLQWTEALLRAELSVDERTEWADRLDVWVESIFRGHELEMAARAARDGWTYPPLVAAMAGNITELGAWAEDDEVDFWFDELAKIRIDILEAKGDLKSACNLAEAEGQYERSLQLKIKLGQSNEAIAETKENLTSPTALFKVAQTLAEAGEISKALELGQHGLDLKPPSKESDPYFSEHGFNAGKATLAAWLRDLAVEAGQPDVALSHAQFALQATSDLPNYIRLQEVARDKWPSLKPKILESVMTGRSTEHVVDILLHEQMYKEVTLAVDQMNHFFSIDKVLNAVQADFPEWAFQQCIKRGETIMDAGNASQYDVAANWLRQGRDILQAAGHDKLWSAYIDVVMTQHQRKRKLIPMLREIA